MIIGSRGFGPGKQKKEEIKMSENIKIPEDLAERVLCALRARSALRTGYR